MTYRFRPRGVCSQEMQVDVDDQGIIQEVRVMLKSLKEWRWF